MTIITINYMQLCDYSPFIRDKLNKNEKIQSCLKTFTDA